MITASLPLKSIQILSLNETLRIPSKGLRMIFVLEGRVTLSVPDAPTPNGPESDGPGASALTRVSSIDSQAICGTSGEIFSFLPGSEVLASPFSGPQKTRIISAVFDIDFIHQYIEGWEAMQFNISSRLGRELSSAGNLLALMASTWYSDSDHRELNLMAQSYHFLALLADRFPGSGKGSRTESRAKQITFYLQANYERPVTLVELAQYLHISSAYLSRYIKAHFHMGFLDYLAKIRLEHALGELESTEESVTAIALNNGFPNVASFNKTFKAAFGMTPNQYRQTHRKAAAATAAGAAQAITPTAAAPAIKPPEMTPAMEQAGIMPAANAATLTAITPAAMAGNCGPIDAHKAVTIEVEPVQRGTLNRSWHDMINLGFGLHCSQTKFQDQLTALIAKIHFDYGRIQGIFKDYNAAFANAPAMYPFSELDGIFDFFARIHLLPHIDFAYMSHKSTGAGQNPNLELIRRFLKYFSKRYGNETLRLWRFEYSMPAKDQQKPLLTPKEYAKNCHDIEQLIREFAPGANFGCFCGSPLFPWKFNEEILCELSKYPVHPDFVCTHLYPYEPSPKVWQEFPILSTNPAFFKSYVHKLRGLCKRYGFGELPLFVTHLQNELGPGAWLNDSAFMAPFLFKTYTDIYPMVHGIAYGAFSDLVYENTGEDPYFFGGSGVITLHGIRKPSYFALFMLSRAPSLIFHHSDGCFITSMDNSSCQILMYNYVHYTTQHCLNCHRRYSLEQTRAQLEEGRPRAFTLDFSRWPPGTYRLQKFRLGPAHGSALDEYLRLGIRDAMLPIELDYLERKCGLDISVEYLDIDSHTLLYERLQSMEICIYVLYRC